METAFRLARFGLVGIVATLVHLGVVVSLVESGVLPEPLVANLFAFSCAVFVSYYGHNYWTFRQRRGSVPQFLRFLVITVMALGLNQLILYVVTRPLGLDYRIGLLLVLCLVPLFTYALSHFWVFRENCGA
ncbi:GtrA family protein [Thiocystis violacea]|uniref:GtrA family protein n=1 Tax=Thiocystis violacea TaxID=13725 RepID=UPI001907221C|nr:GtrA family protein [Thiocystis violacea]